MVAFIDVSPYADMRAIAESAGQPDENLRWYENGKLFISGVTQGALEKALLGYDHEQSKLALENAVAVQRALLRLSQIDSESVRPLRAKAAGTATPDDEEKLVALDAEAEQLRSSLSDIG